MVSVGYVSSFTFPELTAWLILSPNTYLVTHISAGITYIDLVIVSPKIKQTTDLSS